MNKKQALRLIDRPASVVGSAGVIPTLGTILVENRRGECRMTGTNLEVAVRTHGQPFGSGEEWAACIPAKSLLDAIKAAADDEEIEITGPVKNKVTISLGLTKIALSIIPAEEFPVWSPPDTKPTLLSSSEQSGALLSVLYSASTDKAAPLLSTVHFKRGGGMLRAETADRFRGTSVLLPSDGPDAEAIVPIRAMQIVSGLVKGDSINAAFGSENVLFVVGDTEVLAQQIEGRYPDLSMFVTRPGSSGVRVHRSTVLTSLAKAAIIAEHAKNQKITVSVVKKEDAATLKITASADVGRMEDSIEAEGESCGPVGMRHSMLEDAILAAGSASPTGNVYVHLGGAQAPVTIFNDHPTWTAVIMPTVGGKE